MAVFLVDECLDKLGGAERVMCSLANGLYDKKMNINVISETKNNTEPFYNYNKEIDINYLIKKDFIWTSKMKKKNLIYYFLRIFEKLRRNFLLNLKIKKIVKNISDDDTIIFGRVIVALDFLPIIAKYKVNPKIIVRDAINLHFFNKYQKHKIKKYFVPMVNTFIVSSDESINDYNNFFGKCDINIKKIYNPIGIVPNVGYKYVNKTVVTAGRMDDNQKGFDNLIKAFVSLHNKFPDWKLNIYGDGRIKPILQKLIDDSLASDYIFIQKPTKDIVNVFNNSSIFVLASRYEGYANILVEALSCGIPSISYNWLTGVEDIITDNYNGIIVNLEDRKKYFEGCQMENDILNLAQSIGYLIENKSVCDEFSNNSPNIISSRGIDVIVDKWIDEVIC